MILKKILHGFITAGFHDMENLVTDGSKQDPYSGWYVHRCKKCGFSENPPEEWKTFPPSRMRGGFGQYAGASPRRVTTLEEIKETT